MTEDLLFPAPIQSRETRRSAHPCRSPCTDSAAAQLLRSIASLPANPMRAYSFTERPHDMDLTASIEARSDQINADDLLGGPQTYTVREVVQGKAEQPFDFLLVETDRAYRPSKTMRRVIVACLGPDANNYPGVRFTLYREPTIQFGGKTVGGIRISHMSHIDKRVEVLAQVTRGKREKFIVDPLPTDAPPAPTPLKEQLAAEWRTADPERRKAIEAEVAGLEADPA